MLDLKRLIGIVIHSESSVLFKELKSALLKISPTLDADDVAVVQGRHCQGSGEITGAIANTRPLLNDADFVNMTKSVVKAIGEAEINSPKRIYILTDSFSPAMQQTAVKMRRLCKNYDYRPILHFVQIGSNKKNLDEKSNIEVVSTIEDMNHLIVSTLEESLAI